MAGNDGNQNSPARPVSLNRWGDYVGIPFVEGAADPTGCDCWGLVRFIYATNFGIILDKYADVSPRELRKVAEKMRDGARSDPQWTRVESDEVEPYDVCLMRVQSSSLVAHAGIMTDRRHVLHVEQATRSCIVPIDHQLYRNRIVGFYRHRDMP